jgi:ribosomal protein L32
MPKHPVPKQKTSKARGSRRYKSFQNKARKRLTESVNLTKCESCQATKQMHHACPECGDYRGKLKKAEAPKSAPKKEEKVEKIKAE